VKVEKPRKERLSIYLVKETFTQDSQLINLEKANAPIPLAMLDEKARLYIKREIPRASPVWTKLFLADPNVPADAFGKGNMVGAVAVVESEERLFLLTFGSGHHLVKDESIERDFGLRVTLNSVSPEKLRSLDKASYEHNPLNSRTQSTQNVDIFDLNIDSELDILYAVTGISNEPFFGTVVTGRDALTIAVETNLQGILEILKIAKGKYESKLPFEFEWVDNVQRVKDKDTLQILDLELDDALSGQSEAILWLGEPEIVDWETQYGYSFDLHGSTPRLVVLSLEHLREYLAQKGISMTVELLKSQSVHINNAEWQSVKTWSAYRCIYAELPMGPEQYILRNGLWFRVEKKFADEVDKSLADLQQYKYKLPIYQHEREDDYNQHVVMSDASFQLMDKKTSQIGGPYDKLEFCDLIRERTDLIHVKYYRSSGTLSHLFAQGYVAAEAFVKDLEYRTKVNSKLPKSAQLVDVKARPNPNDYLIVYAIATTKQLPNDLPFFSKITLKNAVKTLKALNFRVEISAIEIDPKILVTKKFKSKKAPAKGS